ncbi:hypothetical protein AMECASPLE_028273, partial [Ameca splendens]
WENHSTRLRRDSVSTGDFWNTVCFCRPQRENTSLSCIISMSVMSSTNFRSFTDESAQAQPFGYNDCIQSDLICSHQRWLSFSEASASPLLSATSNSLKGVPIDL